MRYGHHAAVGGQVGLAGFVGDGDGFDGHFAHLFTTIVELVERDLSDIVGNVEAVTGLLRQVEALLPLDGIIEGLCHGCVAEEGQQHQGKSNG